MGWWRNYVRSKSQPIHPLRAKKWRNFLSGLYFFAAWNALSLGIYMIVKTRLPTKESDKTPSSKYYASIIGTGDAKVFRFKGLQFQDEFEIIGTQRPEPGKTREERERAEMEKKKKIPDEDLKILVEETSSL